MLRRAMKTSLCGVCLLLAGLCSPQAVAAHPHVFAECTLGFVFNAQGLSGVTVRWVFDEMFTAMILDMVDANHDGALSPAEVRKTEKEAFANLKQFNYFMYVSVDGRTMPVREASGFAARVDKGQLAYAFTVPVPVPAPISGAPHKVVAWSFDKSYYTGIALGTGDPPLTGQAKAFHTAWAFGLGARIGTPYGGFQPDAVVLTFSRP